MNFSLSQFGKLHFQLRVTDNRAAHVQEYKRLGDACFKPTINGYSFEGGHLERANGMASWARTSRQYSQEKNVPGAKTCWLISLV